MTACDVHILLSLVLRGQTDVRLYDLRLSWLVGCDAGAAATVIGITAAAGW